MRRISLFITLLFFMLSCLSCRSSQTLDALQQQAYAAIEENNTENACQLILQAEALYPGELDSALYQLLLAQAKEDLEQAPVLAAYETLCRRGELDAAQLQTLGQHYQTQGDLLKARDLYELSLRRENHEEVYALLQNLTIPFDQEDAALQTYLLQAASAASEERMSDLISLLQSAEWLNAAMPSTGAGGRFYETEEKGTRIRIAAELTDQTPVTTVWLLTSERIEKSICISPQAISLITAPIHEGTYHGAASAEILEISSGTFYHIDANLQHDLFSGSAIFQLFSVAPAETAAECWQHREDTPTGTFSGSFSEDGHPQAQQQSAEDAVVVGYDGSNEKYLALHIPEGLSAQDGVSIFWLPAAKVWEGQ
ncbi:MAG: hypothetical protein HFE64_00395 [Lachnospiraceae bacterium]|jgi:tetratricopeptide (TPR) repeat protein|nr:hypothetical protein [Lachnospiraceae bacterium]